MISIQCFFQWKSLYMCFLLMVVCVQGTMAEGVIKGIVLDKKTQEPIIGAAVMIANTTTGVATGVNGDFMFEKTKAGSYTLKVSFISYTPVTISNVAVVDNKEVVLKIELEEEAISV